MIYFHKKQRDRYFCLLFEFWCFWFFRQNNDRSFPQPRSTWYITSCPWFYSKIDSDYVALGSTVNGYSTSFWVISLQNLEIFFTWTPQGWQVLNVIRPSCTPPKTVRSSHGKWKPKFCLTFVAKYCICVSVTVKNRFLSVSKGKIEVPAIFYYGIPSLP